jgi:hypothetical protein
MVRRLHQHDLLCNSSARQCSGSHGVAAQDAVADAMLAESLFVSLLMAIVIDEAKCCSSSVRCLHMTS